MQLNIRQKVRVFVVAPSMLRWGLARLVGSEECFELAGEAESLDDAGALSTARVDVLLLDIDPQESQRALHERPSLMRQVPILALSSADTAELDWALMNGLRGVVRKSDQPTTILKAIAKVHEGETWVSRVAVQRILERLWQRPILPISETDHARAATLTLRERQTMLELTRDASVPCKVIADRLNISAHTLRNHLTSIYAKLEVRGRVDLYAFVIRYESQRHGVETARNEVRPLKLNGNSSFAGPTSSMRLTT